MYLIWSNDAMAWWKPNNAGYTGSTADAGRYSREDALKTCCHGRDGWNPNRVTPEIPVRESDVLEIEEMQRVRKAKFDAHIAAQDDAIDSVDIPHLDR